MPITTTGTVIQHRPGDSMQRAPSVSHHDHSFPLDPAFDSMVPFPDLSPGTRIEIVKLDPAGEHVVTYPGVVLPNPSEPDWLITEARWVKRTVDLGGLTFHTGDRLIEIFSAGAPFNCFAVHDPETDELRGWYANVTHPARVENYDEFPRLIWHDLYLDVVGNPSGYLSLRDEDELAESGLEQTNPALYAAIVRAAGHVQKLMANRSFPFQPGAVQPISPHTPPEWVNPAVGMACLGYYGIHLFNGNLNARHTCSAFPGLPSPF